jgi:hypothetical protein
MSTKVPNFNTFSTIIDRLSIENVKLSHFEFLLAQDGSDKSELDKKVQMQLEMVKLIRVELENFMLEVFLNKNYEYIDEERTFK